MIAYILRRVLQAIPVIVITSLLIFMMLRAIPGDPAAVICGPDCPKEQLDAVRREMGLDRPWYAQYVIWLWRALHGDLGRSFINDFPVNELLRRTLPVTLELTFCAFFIAIVVCLPVGLVAAVKPRSVLGVSANYYTSLGLAVPTFWLGILLALFFGFKLGLLPVSGYKRVMEFSPFRFNPQNLKFLVLPSVNLGIGISAILARFLKSSLEEVLTADYVRTARAKGLKERVVITRHALKNSLITVVTVLGLQLGAFMGGAVVTEAIFRIPGLGNLFWQAVLKRDYFIVQGLVLFIVISFLVINLITDLVYAFLDPRIRYR